MEKEMDDYILFFNEQRPAYSLNYLTPKQYRESYSSAFSVLVKIAKYKFEISCPILLTTAKLF